MQNLVTVSQDMCNIVHACKGSQEIFGTLVSHPLGIGCVADPRNTRAPLVLSCRIWLLWVKSCERQ